MMKYARAHHIVDKILIQGYAKTTAGLNTLDGPVLTSNFNDVNTIGKNVLSILKEAGKIIPHPTQEQWKVMSKTNPILAVTSIKTWNAFIKKAKIVEIEEVLSNKLLFIPTKFGGTSGDNKGHHQIEDKTIICETDDPESLGKALLQAFEFCE